MNKKIGIPRGLFYYHYIDKWKAFFDKLDIDYIISPKTTKEIIYNGSLVSEDEMCLSMKIFLGHVDYLKDKCDYILVPRIDNYGCSNETCTNFLSAYDIVSNLFNKKILNYNIDLRRHETELKGFIKIGEMFGYKKGEIKKIYKDIIEETKNKELNFINENVNNLDSDKIKILLVGHPYNLYDNYIGMPIIKMLQKLNVEIIYSDLFDKDMSSINSSKISSSLYYKFSKEIIGSIPLSLDKIDGIIFISSFPCGPDSIVNNLAIKSIKLPNILIVIDDNDSLVGTETRIESFIDILESGKIDG